MFNLSLETFVGNFSFTLLFLIMLFYWFQAIFSLIPNFNFIIFLITLCGNLNLIFLLIIRWSSYKHFPLSNLYESLIFLSWSFTSIQLFFLYPEFSLNKNSLTQTHQIRDKLFTKNQNFPESFANLPSSAVNFFCQLLPTTSIETNISYSTIFFPDNLIKKNFNNLSKNRQKSFSQPLKEFQKPKITNKQSSQSELLGSNNSKNLNVFSSEEPTLKKTNFSGSFPKLFSSKISTNKFSIIVGTILSPMALFINSFATFSLPKNMQAKQALVPALQSNWLMMHVTIMMLSYTALLFGSLLAISFLIVNWVAIKQKSIQQLDKNKNAGIINTNQINYSDSLLFLDNEKLSINNALNNFNLNKNALTSLAKILDNLSYRVLGIGFPLLTIGILSGSVWANEAWGSYWSWDPKETWAFITWLVFAIYLHGRIIKGWEGKKPAIVASVGFFVVWICYLGVNIFGTGLHSYGWLK